MWQVLGLWISQIETGTSVLMSVERTGDQTVPNLHKKFRNKNGRARAACGLGNRQSGGNVSCQRALSPESLHHWYMLLARA